MVILLPWRYCQSQSGKEDHWSYMRQFRVGTPRVFFGIKDFVLDFVVQKLMILIVPVREKNNTLGFNQV